MPKIIPEVKLTLFYKGSIPGQCLWDLWWAQYPCVPLSLLFHQCSTLIYFYMFLLSSRIEGQRLGIMKQSSALANVGEWWAGRYLNVLSKLIKCNIFCPVRGQPSSVYFFQFATDLPGMMFSNLTSMYWSLSALDCSWKMPSACSSSWIERPSPPRQLGPSASGGRSDSIWGPPNLPTYDQHLSRSKFTCNMIWVSLWLRSLIVSSCSFSVTCFNVWH
jgi:hypothetical protein